MPGKRGEKKLNIYILFVALSVFILDRISKYLILEYLDIGKSAEVVKNLFYLTLVQNTGAAFGIFRNQTIFFIVVSVSTMIVIVTILLGKKKYGSPLSGTALAFVLGGAAGNLFDRLRFGYVIDFLDFRVWPVFNVADSAITVGAFLLIIGLFKKQG